MFKIECMVLYIGILQIIHKPLGLQAIKISINHNITGLVDKNDTHLTCSFIKDINQDLINVAIIASNKNGIFPIKEPVAVLPPDKATMLLPSGYYLPGRVTLINITKESTTASLRFDNLECEDEKDYICSFAYIDVLGFVNIDESELTRVLVKTFPSMPYSISCEVAASIRIKKQDNSPANCTNNRNNISLSNNRISRSSLLTDTVNLTQFLTTEKSVQSFREGDTVQFTCTGNIGKPPGRFVWEVIPQQGEPIFYSNETTVVVDQIPDICSYRGYSNLTVEITADHFKAKVRCFEESLADVKGMFVETDPLNVYFQTRLVNVNKQPNQKQYDRKTDQINLTCTAIGKPEPEYRWFKQDLKRNILSRTNYYVIGDVNPNNSGIYICEAFNIINNVMYKNSYSVAIDIVDKLLQKESESMKFFIVHAAYAVSFTCTVVVVILCLAIRKRYCNREKRNIHSDDQENISVDNDYAEIERISYHEVNLHNDRNETSNQPITEEEIVLENIPISTCTSSSERNIPFSYLYVNTDIFNTNENRKVAAQHESIYDHSNGLENCNIGVENTIDSDNSGSDTLHVNQYVNTTNLRVPNVYEDLDHTTVDTHTYESPHIERNTTCTE